VKTFEFKFDEPIEFSHGGERVEGNSITFYAPKPKQRKKTGKLKQAFFRALPTEGNENQSSHRNEEVEISGAEVLFLVAHSKETDYPDFIETGRSLICDQVGKIDDTEYFTTFIADNIELDVLEEMIGEYIANFIVRSSLQSLTKR